MLCICTSSHCCNHCTDNPNLYYPVAITYEVDQSTKTSSFLTSSQLALRAPDDLRHELTLLNPELAKYMARTTITHRQQPQQNDKPLHPSNINKTEPAENKSQINKPELPPQQNKAHPDPKEPKQNPSQAQQFAFRVPRQKSQTELRLAQYTDQVRGSSRQLSDTTFRRYFGKQCMEPYGRKNTQPTKGGIIYGDYMKTHSVNPHQLADPVYYQTYDGALRQAKKRSRDASGDQNRLIKQFERKHSENQYRGTCKQTSSHHVYDTHDEKHRTNIFRNKVREGDRHIDQIQHHNHKHQHQQQRNLKIEPAQKQTIIQQPRPEPPKQTQTQPQRKAPIIIELRHESTQTVEGVKLQQAPQRPVPNKAVSFVEPARPKFQAPLPQKPQLLAPPAEQTKQHIHTNLNYAQSICPAAQFYRSSSPLPYRCCDDCSCRSCSHYQNQKTAHDKQRVTRMMKLDARLQNQVIASAKQATMYKNYSLKTGLPNDQPCHNYRKQYYQLAPHQLNPKNYKHPVNQCVSQIPAAGIPYKRARPY